MQVSKRNISGVLKKQIDKMWYQLVADIKTPEEAEVVLGGLLSETESEAISKRLAVGYWLSNNRSYENIKENLKVSSATIASIQQELKKPEWELALKKVRAEEWASKWEAKIKSRIPLFRK